MQSSFAVAESLQTARGSHIARHQRKCHAQRGAYSALFCRERFVQPRLATISHVAMNDPALGRLVDCRNRRANPIGIALWRGADLFLQSAQVRLNASIMDRPFECLSSAFSG
jgi:hypothetical protein